MSGGIVSWVEGPDQTDVEEDRRWQRRYALGRTVRTPGGKGLSDAGAQEYASDARYLMFADFVSPLQWQSAAQQRKHTLRQVVSRLFQAGPDPVLTSHMGMTVEDWQAAINRCYSMALADDRTEAEDFEVRWHLTGGHVNGDVDDDPEPFSPEGMDDGQSDQTDHSSVSERPATPNANTDTFLQRVGITKHTEGRPDRPSRTPEYRRRQRREKKQALGRARTTEEPTDG